MNTVVKIQPKDIGDISFQEASFDIWDKKYRLTAKDGSPIDRSMDDTYKRVARALADVFDVGNERLGLGHGLLLRWVNSRRRLPRV